MQEVSFEEALELIRARDPRYPGDAYLFVREALDYTQKMIVREAKTRVRHVTGRELLEGIKAFALSQFGPMTPTVFAEWGIYRCQDFGEIVFNMVEAPGCSAFAVGDFTNAPAFVGRLKVQSEPIAQFLWNQISDATHLEALTLGEPKACEAQLVKEFNQIIRSGPVYQPERFVGIQLSDQAKSLVAHSLQGTQLARVNRLLLEEVYPSDIAKSPGLLAKTEEDSRADFADGYDFWEAFSKPYLPSHKLTANRVEINVAKA